MTPTERRLVVGITWRAGLCLVVVLAACSLSTLNRVDPYFYQPDAGAMCPMTCALGCCTLGSTYDGYECSTNVNDHAPCIYTGTGVVVAGGKKRAADAGVDGGGEGGVAAMADAIADSGSAEAGADAGRDAGRTKKKGR